MFELTQLYNDRDKWYRISEREHKSTKPMILFREGDWVTAERIIVRCGYLYEPLDMPVDLEREWVERYLLNRLNSQDWQPKNYGTDGLTFQNVERWLNRDIEYLRFAKVDLWKLQQVLGISCAKLFGSVGYHVRQIWCSQTIPADLKDIRTFWYVDGKDGSQFRELITRLIGRKFPGSSYGSYESGYDYDPPYFDRWITQRLYKLHNSIFTGCGKSDMGNRLEKICVHPLDLEGAG